MQDTNPTPVAVITGGARGIGEAAARKFAANGHAVAILDVNRGRGEALARELASPRVRFYECDVADAGIVAEVAARTQSELGPARVLATSAALIPNSESVLDMDLAAHDLMWRVNYQGTVLGFKGASQHRLLERRIVGHSGPLPAFSIRGSCEVAH